jgi:hypothetical protein
MRNVSVPLTLMANWLSRQRLCIQYNLGASTFVSATMHAPRDLHQKAASGAVDARKTEFVEALQSDLLGPVLFRKILRFAVDPNLLLLTKELRWPGAPPEVPIPKRTSAEMSQDA